jgi:hypothetical protein
MYSEVKLAPAVLKNPTECWSDGVLGFPITPPLHHSIPPSHAIRNCQSVFGQARSSPVKPSQTRSCLFPTSADGLGLDQPSHVLWCACQNAQGMVVCHCAGTMGGQDFANSRILSSQTQSNPVKPFPPGTQRGCWSAGVLFFPRGASAFPPGQWPGGTGGSPVLPKKYEISGLAARQKK